MESPARELDETATDCAIAGILSDDAAADLQKLSEEPLQRASFPSLTPQDETEEDDKPQETGVAAILRQTWAHLSGAA